MTSLDTYSKRIEKLRLELIKIGLNEGLTSKNAVSVSEQLDKLILEYVKISNKLD